mmetsp:Transcript_101453/g.293472  ORF Transcript_101453/g.293472 Transcript_101453/m.293472 type:complete len:256 (-) Transcript_101453:88-855(-)
MLMEHTPSDFAGGYMLWMMSKGKKLQDSTEEDLLKIPVSSTPSTPVLKVPQPLHRRIVSEGPVSYQMTPEELVSSPLSHDAVRAALNQVQMSFTGPLTPASLIDDEPPTPPRACSPLPSPKDLPQPSSSTITLPRWFKESTTTVVIGKGHLPRKTPGNLLLRQMVRDRLDDYQKTNRRGRATIVSDIYTTLQKQNPDGRCFGNFDPEGHWNEAKEPSARDKIAATFRDCLSHLYKSSTQSKVAKRRKRKAERSRK